MSSGSNWNVACGAQLMKSLQAFDSFPVLNSDLDIKQAAAVTLELTQALQGVAWVSNLGQIEAVNKL